MVWTLLYVQSQDCFRVQETFYQCYTLLSLHCIILMPKCSIIASFAACMALAAIFVHSLYKYAKVYNVVNSCFPLIVFMLQWLFDGKLWVFKVIDHMPGACTQYVHTTARYIVNFNMISMIIRYICLLHTYQGWAFTAVYTLMS